MKMKINLLLLALVWVFFGCKSTQESSETFVPTFALSKKTTHKIPKGQNYSFGYLKVLENRENPTSRIIEIPVYIFKSRSKNPKKDPILYTVGGPGSTTMPSARFMNYYQYLDDRDFILIEQRGNYYSKPHLDCPEWSRAIYESNQTGFNQEDSDELFNEAARACKKRLEQKKIDLNGYHTNAIAADINDLMNVLKIEKYNLLTISYSTKIAQVLMRDYPNKIRSVVMDSPLPLEVNYDEESVSNLLESVSKLLLDCERDDSCQRAYPNIKARFFDYLAEKTENPLEVQIKNPNKGNLKTFRLKGEDLISVFTSASTSGVKNIPFQVNQLLNNDLTLVKERLAYLFEKPSGGAGIGMRLSVWCAEEYPFSSSEIIREETNKYPQVKGLSPAVFNQQVCEIWGVKPMSAIENQAIQSTIPVLLISGEYDNETPVKWAKSMKVNLSNSYHLIFKSWKHIPTTNWSNPCAMESANDFFNNPESKPNPDCLEEIKMPNFRVK